MTELTIFVGDTSDDLCKVAQEHDPTAYLVDSQNLENSHEGTVFTSIGDIDSLSNFFKLLLTAKKIVYSPPSVWSDKKTNCDKYSAAWLSEHYIRLAATLNNTITENIQSKITGVVKSHSRKSMSQTLWVAGCSTTHGIGVDSTQKYQAIVGNALDIPVVDLSYPGSSISWARDQILMSDIKQHDIVVWGLTTIERFPWFHNNQLDHINPRYYEKNPGFDQYLPFSLVDADHRVYESLSSIKQVSNFCNKIDAHLILINIHGNLDILADCAEHKNFIIIHGKDGTDWHSSFLDFGNDNQHPGPETHKMYANLILEKIKTLT